MRTNSGLLGVAIVGALVGACGGGSAPGGGSGNGSGGKPASGSGGVTVPSGSGGSIASTGGTGGHAVASGGVGVPASGGAGGGAIAGGGGVVASGGAGGSATASGGGASAHPVGGGGAGGGVVSASGGTGSGGAAGSMGCPVESPIVFGSLLAGTSTVLLIGQEVTVMGVETCAALVCPALVPLGAVHIALSGPGAPSLDLYVKIPGLPADLIAPGETLGLTARSPAAAPSTAVILYPQTIVLAREQTPILFTSSLVNLGLPVPDLSDFGITVSDRQTVCEDPPVSSSTGECVHRQHAASVTFNKHTGTAVPGQSIVVDVLSFSLAYFDEQVSTISCTTPGAAVMGGFVGVGGS